MLGEDPLGTIWLIGFGLTFLAGGAWALMYWLKTPANKIDLDNIMGPLMAGLVGGLVWPAVLVLLPITYGLIRLKERIHAES